MVRIVFLVRVVLLKQVVSLEKRHTLKAVVLFGGRVFRSLAHSIKLSSCRDIRLKKQQSTSFTQKKMEFALVVSNSLGRYKDFSKRNLSKERAGKKSKK